MTDQTITQTDNPITGTDTLDVYDFECTPIERLCQLPREPLRERTEPPMRGRVYVFTEPTTKRKRYFVERDT